MSSRAQALLSEALALPIGERADVAAGLIASLEDSPLETASEVETAWAHEIERRARCVMNAESSGEPWDQLRGRVLQQITR